MRNLLSPENPLFLLYQGRLRRWSRWSWALFAVALVSAIGSEDLLFGLVLALLSLAGIPLVLALSAIPACLRSVSEHVDELLVSGISPSALVDTGSAFLALRWWQGCRWVLAACLVAVLGGKPCLAVGATVLWMAFLPLALFCNYLGMASQVLASRGQSMRLIIGYLVGFYGMLFAIGLAFQLVALVSPVLATGCLIPVTMGMLLACAVTCRRFTLRWLQSGGGPLAPLAGSGGAWCWLGRAGGRQRPSSRWSVLGHLHPLLYRYHSSRLVWRGTPVWFLSCLALGILGAVAGQLHFFLGALFLGYAAFFLLLLAGGSQLSFIQQELGPKNRDLTLTSFTPKQLVDGLALVRLQPRLLEGLLLIAPGTLVLSLKAPSSEALGAIWVLVLLGLGWMLLDTYATVFCSLWLLGRNWLSAAMVVVPMFSYLLALLSLSGVVSSHRVLWGSGACAAGHWAGSAMLGVVAMGLLALCFRHRARWLAGQ